MTVTPVTDLLTRYGWRMTQNKKDIQTIEEKTNFSILVKLLSQNINPTIPLSEFKDAFSSDLFERFDFYIANVEKWAACFGVNMKDIPLPLNILSNIRFIWTHPDVTSNLITSVLDIEDITASPTLDDYSLRAQLVPEFRLAHIFYPKEAEYKADQRIFDLIETLDELPDFTKSERFKSELLETAVSYLKKKSPLVNP